MTDLFHTPLQKLSVNGLGIAARVQGSGPPLLLLHGHPQTHAIWHKVWPELVLRHTCVAADLRGYGDSDKPASSADHAPYSKREMARDMVELMDLLGFARFDVLAHDRGARVAHRLGMDHPERVRRMMLLDIAPTLDMYEGTTRGFAQAYFHWFWLIQPAPLPETMIAQDSAFYVRSLMGARPGGLAHFAPVALAEYERCAALPGWAEAVCEDYRASASIDLEHDRADRAAGRRLRMPLRALWGGKGAVHAYFDPLALWRGVADDSTGEPLACGHYVPEEAPQLLLPQIAAFFYNDVDRTDGAADQPV